MRRVSATTKKWTRLARKAAVRAGAVTQRSAVSAAESLYDKGHAWRHGAQAKRLADKVLRAGERLIERSPLPVPMVMRDALGRMQDALGQLGNTIEGLDAGVDAKTGQQVSLRADKGAKHYTGRVPASSAGEFAAATAREQGQHHGKSADKHSHRR